MFVGRLAFAPPLSFDPLSSTARPHSPADRLQRALRTTMDRRTQQQQIADMTASVRERALTGGRSGLYQELANQLAGLAASLRSPTRLDLGGSQGLLGPSAKLSELAPQLGLQTYDGHYAFELNGARYTFSADQTLNDVLTGINSQQTGIEATFDPQAQAVTLAQLRAGGPAIVASDVQGNLMTALGLTPAQRSLGPTLPPTAGNDAPIAAPRLQALLAQTYASSLAGSGRASVADSRSPLALGPGSATSAPTLDPNGLLKDQPFATAISAGAIAFSVQVDGASIAQRLSVAVDPSTDSLNSVLQRISALKVGVAGVQKSFVSASYDPLGGQVSLSLNTTGPTADFNVLANQPNASNFFNVVMDNAPTVSFTVTAGSGVAAGRRSSNPYKNLSVMLDGAPAKVATGPVINQVVPSSTAAAAAVAPALTSALGTAGLPITASASAGRLTLTTAPQTLGANPDVQIALAETGPRAALTLGLASANDTIQATVVGRPQLAATAATGPLGPEASLAALAPQLGLVAVNNQYAIAVNGTRLTFSGTQSLNDVLAGINHAGVGLEASFDPTSRRVVASNTSPGAGSIDLQDLSGNLIQQLGLANTPAIQRQGSPADQLAVTGLGTTAAPGGQDALNQLASGIDAALALLDAASGTRQAPFAADPLLKDLRTALAAVLTPGASGALQTLGDLGFTRLSGSLQVDGARLQQLIAERPAETQAMLDGYLRDTLGPLLSAGARALQDDLASAPLDRRLAQANVAARAEIERLQQRQMLLLFQQTAASAAMEGLKRQRGTLEDTRTRLESQHATDETARRAAPSALGMPAPAPPGGLMAFGLGN